MKKKLLFTFLGVLTVLVGTAQTDTTEVYVSKNFSNYKSIIQFSLGWNIPVGSYWAAKQPYSSAFASSNIQDKKLNLNAKYSRRLKSNYGYEIGVEFIRNSFDWRRFSDNYLEATGDSVNTALGVFLYEHLSFYGGMNYNYSYKRFMATANIGGGILYNFPIPKNGSVTVPIPRSSFQSWGEGPMTIVKGFVPMFYAGLNLKYYLGDEYYFVVNSQFTYSMLKINIQEKFVGDVQREYLEQYVSINNIGLTIGLGTIIN